MVLPSIDIIHCCNHVLAVNKAACTPSVPDASGEPSELDAARAAVERMFNKPGRAWLANANRLDRPVSGAMIFARTSKAASRLGAAFAARDVLKVYWGLLNLPVGAAGSGTVRHYLIKNRRTNNVRVVQPNMKGAKEAVTDWRVIEPGAAGRTSLVEFRPRTGRPHQIRLAAASLGSPLLGDLRYARGAEVAPLPDRSIALHARSIEFLHPTKGLRMRVVAPPPMSSAIWSAELCVEAKREGSSVVWMTPDGTEEISPPY
jgi:23S rRNA pseudouridine1911/1915/1917 synthase